MEKLIELQGIDTKLKDINDLLGDLPSKVEGLNQQEESMKTSLIENKGRLKELEVEMHKREVDIAQIDEKVNKLKDQLFLVTNNKQYDALMTEIDHFKDKKSTFESKTVCKVIQGATKKHARLRPFPFLCEILIQFHEKIIKFDQIFVKQKIRV